MYEIIANYIHIQLNHKKLRKLPLVAKKLIAYMKKKLKSCIIEFIIIEFFR